MGFAFGWTNSGAIRVLSYLFAPSGSKRTHACTCVIVCLFVLMCVVCVWQSAQLHRASLKANAHLCADASFSSEQPCKAQACVRPSYLRSGASFLTKTYFPVKNQLSKNQTLAQLRLSAAQSLTVSSFTGQSLSGMGARSELHCRASRAK